MKKMNSKCNNNYTKQNKTKTRLIDTNKETHIMLVH